MRLPCPLRTRFSIGPLRAPLGGHGHLQMPPSHQPISTAMPRASAQVSILTLIFFFFFFFGTNSTLLYLLQFHSLQRFSLSSSPAQLRPCLSCRLASLSLSFVFFSFLPACLPAACWTCTATVVFGYHQQSAAGCFFASLLFFACLLVNFPLILWVIHFVSCFLFQNIFLLHCFGAPVPRLSLLACFTILTCAKHP